jgi:hypothetical protein
MAAARATSEPSGLERHFNVSALPLRRQERHFAAP